MTEYVVVLSTCPEKDAEIIGRNLVESKKCACVNILRGVTSIYHWKGEIETDSESILLMKTKIDLKEVLFTELQKLHPYEVPEFVVLPIKWGSREYLDWIGDNTIRDV